MKTIAFQPQSTWRKLGYQYFQDSLSYRRILDSNPQWNVMENPPIGGPVLVPQNTASNSGLIQSSFMVGQATGSLSNRIFPFATEKAYREALSRYTLPAVRNRQSLNGYSYDSVAAQTGIQTG